MTAAALSARTGFRRPNDRWYVTAPATVQSFVAGELITLPVSIAHAKEMGTTRTACGLWCYSWRGMLELTFPMPPGLAPAVAMCPTCVGHVLGNR